MIVFSQSLSPLEQISSVFSGDEVQPFAVTGRAKIVEYRVAEETKRSGINFFIYFDIFDILKQITLFREEILFG